MLEGRKGYLYVYNNATDARNNTMVYIHMCICFIYGYRHVPGLQVVGVY